MVGAIGVLMVLAFGLVIVVVVVALLAYAINTETQREDPSRRRPKRD